MKCPKCLSKGVKKIPNGQVIDTRSTDAGAIIRRRRICPKCDHRWTTAESESQIVLSSEFTCPICGMDIYVSEVSEWEQDDDGKWKAQTVKIDCVSDPDFTGNHSSEAMNDHLQSHWRMPYVDWLPLEKIVTEWVNERYSWSL